MRCGSGGEALVEVEAAGGPDGVAETHRHVASSAWARTRTSRNNREAIPRRRYPALTCSSPGWPTAPASRGR